MFTVHVFLNRSVLLYQRRVGIVPDEGLAEFTIAEASTNLHRLDAHSRSALFAQLPTASTSCGRPARASRSNSTASACATSSGLPAGSTVTWSWTSASLNAFSLSLIEEIGGLMVVTTPELPSLFETVAS